MAISIDQIAKVSLDSYLLGGHSTKASEDYSYFTSTPHSPPYDGSSSGFAVISGGRGVTITLPSAISVAPGTTYTFIGSGHTVATAPTGTIGGISTATYSWWSSSSHPSSSKVYWTKMEGAPVARPELVETEKFDPSILSDNTGEFSFD